MQIHGVYPASSRLEFERRSDGEPQTGNGCAKANEGHDLRFIRQHVLLAKRALEDMQSEYEEHGIPLQKLSKPLVQRPEDVHDPFPMDPRFAAFVDSLHQLRQSLPALFDDGVLDHQPPVILTNFRSDMERLVVAALAPNEVRLHIPQDHNTVEFKSTDDTTSRLAGDEGASPELQVLQFFEQPLNLLLEPLFQPASGGGNGFILASELLGLFNSIDAELSNRLGDHGIFLDVLA